MPSNRNHWNAVAACFVSGAAALAYEVLWARAFSITFGSTARSAAAVMAATMAGMSSGAFLYGRLPEAWRRRPSRLYGATQLMLAIYGLLSPWLLSAVTFAYQALPQADPGPTPFWAFLLTVLFTLVPTVAMGLSLPALVRGFEEGGGRVGLLYGFNTAGATFGVLGLSFVILPWIGPRPAFAFAASGNLLAWALAMFWRKGREAPPELVELTRPEAGTSSERGAEHGSFLLLALVFLLGGLAMAEEALFIRLLQLLLGSTLQAFSLMLAVYLAGLSLGALLGDRLEDRGVGPERRLLAALLLCVLGMIWALVVADDLPWMWGGHARSFHESFFLRSALSALMAFLLMGGAALGHGLALPAATACLRRGGASLALARVMAWQTVGNVTGVLVGGFAVGTLFGLEGGLRGVLVLLFLATILAVHALSLVPSRRTRRRVLLGALGFLGAAWLLPPWNLAVLHGGFHIYGSTFADMKELEAFQTGYRLLWCEDGPLTSVSVFDAVKTGGRFMRIDGKTDAGKGQGDEYTQLWAGHLGPLLHGNTERCLIVGLGSGQTLEEVLRYPSVKDVVTVEIAPAVVRGALAAFGTTLGPALKDPRSRLVLDDARHHLARCAESYDLICSEPTNLWVAGTASLFTVEHFRRCKEHLRPGGLLCQWLQGYRIGGREFLAVLRAFYEVFPDALLWCLNGDFHLVGGLGDGAFDYEALVRRWARVLRPELERYPRLSLRELTRGYVCALRDVASYFGRGPLQGDDTPIIEAEVPWSSVDRVREGVIPWPPEAIDRRPMPFRNLARVDEHGLSSWALGIFLERLPVHDARLWKSLQCALVKHHVPSVREPGYLILQPETYGMLRGSEPGISLALLAAPFGEGKLELTLETLFPGETVEEGRGELSGHSARWCLQKLEGRRRFLYWWTCSRRKTGYVLELLADDGRKDWRQLAERFLRALSCLHASKVGPIEPVAVEPGELRPRE